MSKPASGCVRVSGPLASFADGFRAHLVEQGHSLWSVEAHLRLVAHLSRWMAAEGLEVDALTPRVAEPFLAERRRQGYVKKVSPKSAQRLLAYLGGLGVVERGEPVVCTPVARLLDAFRGYLLEERGLAAGSVELYEGVARGFLEERSEPLADDLARLSGAEIGAFVLREARRRGSSSETVVSALRSLLRFLHVRGWIAVPLAVAVPSVARRREDLPRGLPAWQVRLLLDSCDRSTPPGRRDFAVLMLLARLGLRRGEVAGLRLDDLDWRSGEVVIRGKGARRDVLPLPHDVGEAIADYLCRGRAHGFGRALFLCLRAPLAGLSGSGVTSVVVRACRRAGIGPVGAHRLRHTIASELLRRGAGLPEIAQVLRHQTLQTTAIYAKVDRSALSGLALPWPGGRS